ncbi:MAG: fatty acid desaturase [Actinomycetota bacterium]|nr:fatty acid desaturase [Actinomycetota bacterium]
MRSTLDARLRQQLVAERAARPRPLRSATHLLAQWGAYAALAVLTLQLDSVWWKLPIWWVMGWLLVGNGAVVHETLHGHLFPTKAANVAVGVVAGATVGIPFGVYRAYHLGHHQHSCTADDPEGPPYRFDTRWTYLLIPIGGPLFSAQLLWWAARCVVGRPPKFFTSAAQRRTAVRDGLIVAVFFAAMVVAAVADLRLVAHLWLVPWLVAVVVLEPLVLIPEHYGANPLHAASATATTRTVLSNRFVTWAYWANNFHTTHHLVAGLVPQSIPRLSRQHVAGELPPRWVSSGYLAFHWQLLRHPERFVDADTAATADATAITAG